MQQHGISKLDLKRQNRMQILRLLKHRGPISRIDIANTLELTRAAVTIITNEMISKGIIHEIGELHSVNKKAPRGRKKILIDINQNYKFVLGVLIDNDMISVGISTLSGAVLDKRNLDIKSDITYKEIVDFIIESIDSILLDNCLKLDEILGIGFGVFPAMYENAGVEISENGEPDFKSLAVDIYERFKVPLIFDNAVKGMAIANMDFQPEKDINISNIAFLRYGDSLHFVVADLIGSVNGYNSKTDFVDKIIVDPAAVGNDNLTGGSVEDEISRAGVKKKITDAYSKENTSKLYELTDGDVSRIGYETIRAAALGGDEAVCEIIGNAVKLGAVLINNLYYLTEPQKIVLHNIRVNEDEFDYIKKEIAKIAGENVASKIDMSIIERKHGFLSGCAIAIRELFFARGGFDTADDDK